MNQIKIYPIDCLRLIINMKTTINDFHIDK